MLFILYSNNLIILTYCIYIVVIIEACRSSLNKLMRKLVVIEQLLLEANPNVTPHNTHDTVNLNLPVTTHDTLKDFNLLITDNPAALLQYVSFVYHVHKNI